MKNQPGTMTTQPGTMKTDLEVKVEGDLRQLGKVLIFRDTHTEPSYYI